MDEQTQKSMYRVFNILSNKMPIIFIADIQQIVGAKNDFVSKIIQQQIEVPYSLYPINIWNNFLIIYMRV